MRRPPYGLPQNIVIELEAAFTLCSGDVRLRHGAILGPNALARNSPFLASRRMHAADEFLERDDDPSVHLLVPAEGQPLPETRAWPSIFDLAAAMAFGFEPPAETIRSARRSRGCGDPALIQNQVHTRIEREPGRISCRRLHYLDTDAWRDQEAERRARQVLPRPPRQTFRLRKGSARR